MAPRPFVAFFFGAGLAFFESTRFLDGDFFYALLFVLTADFLLSFLPAFFRAFLAIGISPLLSRGQHKPRNRPRTSGAKRDSEILGGAHAGEKRRDFRLEVVGARRYPRREIRDFGEGGHAAAGGLFDR